MSKAPSPSTSARSTPRTTTRAIARQGTSRIAAGRSDLPSDDPLLDFTPVPHVAPRSNSITADLQREFIAHLAATGIVQQAARHIGKSLEALYKLRQRPGAESFRSAWEAAVDRGVARIEDAALARAINGEERAIVSSGKLVGTEIRHNEALVMFFLRNRRPQRYDPARGMTDDIGPGHPLYDRVRRDYEEEQRAIAADPERVREVQAALTRKMAQWRAELEAKWEAERSEGPPSPTPSEPPSKPAP